MNIFIRFIMLASLFVGCSLSDGETPLASGTGSETEATIAAKIVTDDGTAIEGAQVFLYTKDGIPSQNGAFNDTLTDAKGEFSVRVDDGQEYIVEVAYEENGVKKGIIFPPVKVDSGVVEDFGDAQLVNVGTVSGNVVGDAASVRVSVIGTRHEAAVDADGYFSISSVPMGLQYIRVYSSTNPEQSIDFVARVGDLAPNIPLGTVEAVVDTSKTDTTTLPVDTSKVIDGDTTVVESPDDTVTVIVPDMVSKVLIDDFDNRGRGSRLSVEDSSSYWSTWGNGNHQMPDNNDVEAFLSYFDPEGAFGDTGYSFHISLPAEGPGQIGFGLEFGHEGQEFDLTNLEHIEFWSKGSGSITVALEGSLLGNDSKMKAQTSIVLSDNWTLTQIPVEQLKNDNYDVNGIVFESLKTRMTNILFLADDNTEIYIDDLTFTGLDIFDLSK